MQRLPVFHLCWRETQVKALKDSDRKRDKRVEKPFVEKWACEGHSLKGDGSVKLLIIKERCDSSSQPAAASYLPSININGNMRSREFSLPPNNWFKRSHFELSLSYELKSNLWYNVVFSQSMIIHSWSFSAPQLREDFDSGADVTLTDEVLFLHFLILFNYLSYFLFIYTHWRGAFLIFSYLVYSYFIFSIYLLSLTRCFSHSTLLYPV